MARTPASLSLLTKPGCPLCDEMKASLTKVTGALGMTFEEVDISASAELRERYGNDIPVLLADGRVLLQHRASDNELRARLAPLSGE